MSAAGPLPRITAAERVERLLRFGTRRAYLWRDGMRWRQRTYAEVQAGVHGVAAALAAAGVRPGDPVLLQGPDEPDWVEALLGTFLVGGVAVPLEVATAPEFRQRIAGTVKSRLLLAPPSVEPPPGVQRIPLGSWARMAQRPGPGVTPPPTAEIVFTSGTTGDPKGVVLTHDNLAADFAPLEAMFRRFERPAGTLGEIVFISTLPLSHMFGQAMNIFQALYMGLTVAFTAPRPRDILDAAPRLGAFGLFSVPRLLELAVGEVRAGVRDPERLQRLEARLERHSGKPFWIQRLLFPEVRRQLGWKFSLVVSGGAALSDPVREFWERTGILVVQGYGLTETAPIVSISNPFHRGKGNVGRALPGQEIRLGPEGEILVRGANVTPGYFGAESAAGQEWLRTGDIGEIDATGRLVIRGRIKDVIVTPEGENVYATDVEAAFQGRPGVREAAVLGLPFDNGEQVHAVLILEPGADAEAVVRDANSRLLPKQRVRGWTVWKEADFPRTSTGKVRRLLLRERILAGRKDGAEVQAPAAAGGVRQLLSRVARVPAERLEESKRLAEDLGLASLDLVEVAAAFEQEFGVSLPEESLATATVGDLERAAHGALTGSPGLVASGTVAPPGASGPPDSGPGGSVVATRPTLQGSLRMPRWARFWPLHALRRLHEEVVQRPFVHFFARPVVSGLEHLRTAQPPYLFVANHHSYMDTGLLKAVPPMAVRGRIAPGMTTRYHRVYFGEAAGTRGRYRLEAFQVGLVNFFFNAWPLPETAGFRRSLVYAGEMLDAGFSLVIFPEGRHVPDGTMEPFRGGIGVFARELRAPVIPVHFEGTQQILPDAAYWPSFGRARVVFGAPMEVPADADPIEVTRLIEEAVRLLGRGEAEITTPGD